MLKLIFDYLGIIVKSIDKGIDCYIRLRYEVENEVFQDNFQQIRGIFLKKKCCPQIEFIEDLSGSKVLSKFINSQNEKIYHLVYRVDQLQEKLSLILEQLNIQVLLPIKAGKVL